MIFSRGTATEKASEFLDSQTIRKENWSYIIDSADFIDKICQIGDISENVILVSSSVVGDLSQYSTKGWVKST